QTGERESTHREDDLTGRAGACACSNSRQARTPALGNGRGDWHKGREGAFSRPMGKCLEMCVCDPPLAILNRRIGRVVTISHIEEMAPTTPCATSVNGNNAIHVIAMWLPRMQKN